MVPRPPDWTRAFGRQAPLEVDLGCGRGSYAWQRAIARPDIHVVALDTKAKWIGRLREKARESGLSNLRAIRCDVTEDLPVLFDRGSVAGFTIHHPDPWWKKRHRRRRLVSPERVAELAGMLVERGWVFVQTDVWDMAEEMREIFLGSNLFQPGDADRFRQEQIGNLASHREARCTQLGIPIRRMVFLRLPAPGGTQA